MSKMLFFWRMACIYYNFGSFGWMAELTAMVEIELVCLRDVICKVSAHNSYISHILNISDPFYGSIERPRNMNIGNSCLIVFIAG